MHSIFHCIESPSPVKCWRVCCRKRIQNKQMEIMWDLTLYNLQHWDSHLYSICVSTFVSWWQLKGNIPANLIEDCVLLFSLLIRLWTICSSYLTPLMLTRQRRDGLICDKTTCGDHLGGDLAIQYRHIKQVGNQMWAYSSDLMDFVTNEMKDRLDINQQQPVSAHGYEGYFGLLQSN